MATRAAQYYAGMFDVGAEPDWERVAKSVDLIAANDVRIECLSAVASEGGKMRVPFFARSGRLREHLGRPTRAHRGDVPLQARLVQAT